MELGLKYLSSTEVDSTKTAHHQGSGTLEVFATPTMIALMENAAMQAVSPYLEKNQTTVGTHICIDHIKPTRVGRKVYGEAILKEIHVRKLVFSVKAWDDEGDIGHGTHIRFIVDTKRFLDRLSK